MQGVCRYAVDHVVVGLKLEDGVVVLFDFDGVKDAERAGCESVELASVGGEGTL